MYEKDEKIHIFEPTRRWPLFDIVVERIYHHLPASFLFVSFFFFPSSLSFHPSIPYITSLPFSQVVEQLRCAGMIEAVRISRAAYPYRLLHEDFMNRFGNLRSKVVKF